MAGTFMSLLMFSLGASWANSTCMCHVSLHGIGFLPVAPVPHGDQKSVMGTKSTECVPIKRANNF